MNKGNPIFYKLTNLGAKLLAENNFDQNLANRFGHFYNFNEVPSNFNFSVGVQIL